MRETSPFREFKGLKKMKIAIYLYMEIEKNLLNYSTKMIYIYHCKTWSIFKMYLQHL